MKIENGEIIPGVGIGEFKIGMSKEELLEILGDDYTESYLSGVDWKLDIENAAFWIHKHYGVRQIGVWGDFKGSYKGSVKIGTTLSEIQEMFGAYEEAGGIIDAIYEIVGVDGMCFELDDLDDWDDWDELIAPINVIFVYRIEE
ncbi:MAG: hypothetical protein J1E62_08985 [Lachnospiraceae bacterium]|nr:hypothetical protein [Lachnospiraceae bacterium]